MPPNLGISDTGARLSPPALSLIGEANPYFGHREVKSVAARTCGRLRGAHTFRGAVPILGC